MKDPNFEISRSIGSPLGRESIKFVYGFIVDVLTIEDRQYYIPLVALEMNRLRSLDSAQYIPLESTPDELASTYGDPRNLIGLRVRVQYKGARWRSGTCKVVARAGRPAVGNEVEVPSRGFRYAVAGRQSS